MHAKSDSEVTSLPASSPPRSPRRPAYYVQSPSRDSHDGDSKLSFQSTPLFSPIGSPLHPGLAGVVPRSRDSSHSYARSSLGSDTGPGSAPDHPRTKHHASRRIHSQPHSHIELGGSRSQKGPPNAWSNSFSAIEEEPDTSPSRTIAQIYTILLVLLSAAVFLFLFILLFWLICKPGRPDITLKNVIFGNLYMGQGADASGVPSEMLSVNCTVEIDYKNPSKYFAVHVTPLQAELDVSELTVATSQISDYVQGKNSQNLVRIVVQAVKVPLYGASGGLSTLYNNQASIPLSLTASMTSQYFVVGTMITPRFGLQIVCKLEISSKTMALLTPLTSSCTYNPPL